MKLILALWLAFSAVAAPPLFRAQNGASTAPELWTPADAGLTAYWIADDITGADGDPVDTWPDAVGSNDATASGSARPTLDLAVAGINGKAAVVFDGVDDQASLTTGVSGAASPGFFAFAVMSRSSAGHALIPFASSSGSGRPYGPLLYAGQIYAASTSGYINVADSATGWRLFCAYFDPSTRALRVNGSGVSVTYTPDVITGSFDRIGNLGGFAFSNGSKAFLAISVGAPSLDTIQRLEGWAAHYYGLTANLPGGHPYKTDPPYK